MTHVQYFLKSSPKLSFKNQNIGNKNYLLNIISFMQLFTVCTNLKVILF